MYLRIKNITNTATTFNSDDFLAIDGVTSGTRKVSAYNMPLTNATVSSLTANTLVYANVSKALSSAAVSANLAFTAGTLDTVQAIQTSSSPSFTGLTVSGQTANTLVYLNASKAITSASVSSNLSFTGGTLDTVQGIQTSSSPSFTGLTVSGGTVTLRGSASLSADSSGAVTLSTGSSQKTILGNNSGNVLIGTSTDSGSYKLDVNGATRIQGALTATGNITSSGSISQSSNGLSLDSLATSRTVAQAVVYGGTAGNLIYGLSAYGTLGFTVEIAGVWNGSGSQTALDATSGIAVTCTSTGAVQVYDRVASASIYTSSAGTIAANIPFRLHYSRGVGLFINGSLLSAITDSSNYTGTAYKIGIDLSETQKWVGPLTVKKILGSSTAAEIAAAHRGVYPTWWFPSTPAGTQLITGDDSTFASDTGFWSKYSGASISGGKLNISSGAYAVKSGLMVKGQKYRITATVSGFSGTGSMVMRTDDGTFYAATADGTYTVDFTCGTNTSLVIAQTGTATGAFDDVTVQQLGAQLFPDPSQPGTGNIVRSVGNVPGYSVKAATNKWLIPSSQLERAEVETRANSRATRQGLMFSGTQTRSTSTLGFDIGTAPFCVPLVFAVPPSNPASVQALFILSSTGGEASYSFNGVLTTAGALQFTLYGVAPANYRIGTIPGYVARYGGQTVNALLYRDSSGALYLMTNGYSEPITVTSAGTDPTWAGTISSTYFDLGTINGNLDFNGYLDAALILGNLTTAEADAWNKTGILPARAYVAGGAGTEMIAGDNSTFASDTGWWTKVGGGVTISGGKGNITIATQALRRNSLTSIGLRYRLTYTVSNYTGTGTAAVRDSGGGTYSSRTSDGTTSIDITATDTSVLLTTTVDSTASFDDVTLIPLGIAFQLDPRWDGRGGIGPDVSGGGRHLVLGAGVSPAIPPSLPSRSALNFYGGHKILAITIAAGTSVTSGAVYAEALTSTYKELSGRFAVVSNDGISVAGTRYLKGGARAGGASVALAEEFVTGVTGAAGCCLTASVDTIGDLTRVRLVGAESVTVSVTQTFYLMHLEGSCPSELIK